MKHQVRLRVRYAETDQMGVVYHANYLVWMEIGRVELVRSRGLSYRDLEQSEGLYLTVIEAQCRYQRPARYDQEIIVETEVLRANARIVEFGYALLAADDRQVLATGSTRHLWLDRNFRPARLPAHYTAMLLSNEPA